MRPLVFSSVIAQFLGFYRNALLSNDIYMGSLITIDQL